MVQLSLPKNSKIPKNHRQDLAQAGRRQQCAQVQDLPLEPG